jgi:hypothetical protein
MSRTGGSPRHISDLEDRLSELLPQPGLRTQRPGRPSQPGRRPRRTRDPAANRIRSQGGTERTRRGTRRSPRDQPPADQRTEPDVDLLTVWRRRAGRGAIRVGAAQWCESGHFQPRAPSQSVTRLEMAMRAGSVDTERHDSAQRALLISADRSFASCPGPSSKPLCRR